MRRFYRGSNLSRILSVAEMAALAQYRLPEFAWEYLAAGAENEHTLKANEADFNKIKWAPKTLVANHPPALESTVLDSDKALPMIIGPTGFNGMLWPQADIALAKAAQAKAIPFCLSTVANASIEQIREAVPELDLWFQLYCLKKSSLNTDLLARAKAADVSTLIITSDASVVGNREWDRRSFAKPRQLTWQKKLDVLKNPNWIRRVMIPNGLPSMGNLHPYLPEKEQSPLGAIRFIQEQLDTLVDWDKVAQIRDQWQGKLILKGVLHPDDAKRAAKLGIDALVVSNHGGRQLDGTLSSIEALPAIVDAVGDQMGLILDSGIRRGSDIAKAKALGAKAVMLGRATLFGVASAGQPGADRILEILEEELIRCLNLLGVQQLDQLSPQHLYQP